MIRTLLATTAIAALLSTGALAAENAAQPADSNTTAAEPANPPGMKSGDEVKAKESGQMDGHLASTIIGQSVYNGAGKDGKNIGNVNDLVIGKDGKVASVVVGVGGFLGIGEKDVAIDYSQVSWEQRNGAWWIIVPTTAKELKALPDFDSSSYKAAPAVANDTGAAGGSAVGMAPATTTAPATTGMATAPATTTPKSDDAAADNSSAKTDDSAAADTSAKSDTKAMSDDKAGDDKSAMTTDKTDKSSTAAIDKSELKKVDTSTISANDFIGTTVYGADNSDIGEINDVVLNKDGKVDAVVIGVGGFLGMGEKGVAVGMDNLAFLADDSGSKYLYTEFTKDQLKAQPAYDKSTYAQNRDKMRMSVQ